jgi:hypothetical protein
MPNDKMQAQLTDYLAWAFARLQERTGEKNYELTKRVFREWLDHHEAKLEKWGISPDAWKRDTNRNLADIRVANGLRRAKAKTGEE